MPDDEGGVCLLTCLPAGNCCPQLTECQKLTHCPQLVDRAMACLAFPNLPLSAAFRRGSERVTREVLWNLFSTIGYQTKNGIEILQESDNLRPA